MALDSIAADGEVKLAVQGDRMTRIESVRALKSRGRRKAANCLLAVEGSGPSGN
jgi:hypothetical protein